MVPDAADGVHSDRASDAVAPNETVSKTLGEVAEIVGGRIVGSAEVILSGIRTLEDAGPTDLSFLSNPKYASQVADSQAGAILIAEVPEGATGSFLVVDDPYKSLAMLLSVFYDTERHAPAGIDASAIVHPQARVDPSASIGPLVSVEAGATIGPRTRLEAGVRIGRSVRVGEDCVLMHNVVVRERCVLGNRVVIQPGAVIGSDGFGFAPTRDGYRMVPQVGIVRIGDDVDIGANTTIDRGSLGETKLGNGVKVDNLVQLAHNVQVGDHTAIAARVGISGSTRVGSWVRFGGQVGTVGHIQIGDGAALGAQAGVIGDVPPKAFYSGYPARDNARVLRAISDTYRIGALRKKIQELEQAVRALEGDA